MEAGELTYHGRKWDAMSGSDPPIAWVSTAIVRALNPQCGFVLLDKLEQMDLHTLHEFGAWLEAQGLQAIATRVSTGGECSIIIEDGAAVDAPPQPEHPKTVEGRSILMLNITRGKIPRPQKVVIYGPEGIGKTTLAAAFPDPSLSTRRAAPITWWSAGWTNPGSWTELLTTVQQISTSPGICGTLVLRYGRLGGAALH